MKEYGNDWRNDNIYVVKKENKEDKDDRIVLDKDKKTNEDNNKEFDTNNKNKDIFNENEKLKPIENPKNILKEYKHGNPKEDIKSDIPKKIHIENTSESVRENLLHDILNGSSSVKQSFNEYLKENLFKNRRLELSEKSSVVKLMQKEIITEVEKKELQLILEKLSTKELEEYKNKDIENNLMFREKIDECLDDLKDFKEKIHEEDEKFTNGIKEKLNDHEFKNKLVEAIEDKLKDNKINYYKDFTGGINYEQDISNSDNNLLERLNGKLDNNDMYKDITGGNFINNEEFHDDYDFRSEQIGNNEISQELVENLSKEGDKSEIQKIKNNIKNIDWDDITNDWMIKLGKNQYLNSEIELDPTQDCSRINPLYKHKKWLETVYNNKELNLTDKRISEICGVHLVTIQNWRKIHDIPAKDWTSGRWIDERGYVKLYMPEGYLHPELVPQKGRNVRFEHVVVMEKYLADHPELEWSKKHLIDGKYLKKGTRVHHINFKKSDNRLENLWLYENNKSHINANGSLNECFRDLIKLNQIGFKNRNYYLNTDYDCRKLSSSEVKEILKPVSINAYKDLNLVKEEIKKINWKEISDDWIVKIRENQPSEKEILLDPYSNCSDKNPLYLHKKWVDHLVHHKKFNLTQRRLAKLCGVDRGVIYYWSKVKHNINMENEKRGFGKIQHSANRIRMRVPEGYKNPTVKNNKGWMYEHRYIMERYLVKHPELDWSKRYLIDGKYLNPECKVHHINFDPLDNRLENLWICENYNEHRKLETSLTSFVDDLLKSSYCSFRNGKYHLIV